MNSEKLKGHILILITNILFAVNMPISKYLLPAHVPPEGLTIMRMAFACVMFWIVSLFTVKEKVPLKDLGMLFVCALCGVGINQGLFIVGLNRSSPVDASIIATAVPIFVLLLAAVILKEPITRKKSFGVFMGCAARERQQRRDEGIRQRVRVVAVEKIAAGQLTQHFAVFDPQAENELAVQKQKRRHDQPVDDERERLPDRAGVLIRKVGADRLRPDVPVRRREVVVQRVVIIDGLAAHVGSPRRATASKSICSIWRMQLCCSNCVPLSRYFRL